MKQTKLTNARRALAALCLAATITGAYAESAANQTTNTTPKAEDMKLKALANVVPADDPNIAYIGRIDFADPKKPAFAFPGVQIVARFEGSALDVILSGGGNQNYFNVSVDDLPATVIQGNRSLKAYPIARDLASGEHTVRVWKRTEGNCGIARFGGFALDDGKKLLAPPAANARKIEFVGDSITCGYGNMVSTDHPELARFTPKNENNEISWGALTAKALQADYVATAYSGRGIFRNYDATEKGLLPEIYGGVYPDKPEQLAWDATRYVPDVIVINLGTNDFNSLQNKTDLDQPTFDAKYAEAYRQFIARLRSLYGKDKLILCVVGPMLGDAFPIGQNAWTRAQKAVSGLVAELTQAGDTNIRYLALTPQSPPWGEDWHPSAATHEAMAKQTIAAIKAATGW